MMVPVDFFFYTCHFVGLCSSLFFLKKIAVNKLRVRMKHVDRLDCAHAYTYTDEFSSFQFNVTGCHYRSQGH